MTHTLRPLLAHDARMCAELHARCLKSAWSEAAFKSAIETPGTFGFAHEAGFILCRIASDECELLTIVVSPETRKMGIGHTLLEAAIATLTQQHVRHFWLEVGAGNTAAQALYTRAGFHTISTRRAYYADGEDALVMQKIFST